jgi:hypothetical protein
LAIDQLDAFVVVFDGTGTAVVSVTGFATGTATGIATGVATGTSATTVGCTGTVDGATVDCTTVSSGAAL